MNTLLYIEGSPIIIGNYGNDTIALVQWAKEQSVPHLTVVSVDTGWSAPEWNEHVAKVEAWVRKCGYQTVILVSPVSFPDLIKQRGHFPNTKFQWCANVLKGAPILKWLDEVDPRLEATLWIGHRRASSKSKQHLPSEIKESEVLGERALRYPLIDCSTEERNALLSRAGFSVLSHRSLECVPCVNSDATELVYLPIDAIKKTEVLERSVGKPMFESAGTDLKDSCIENVIEQAKKINETNLSVRKNSQDVLENMGCGDFYGCGI